MITMIGTPMVVLLSKYIIARNFDSAARKMRDWRLGTGDWSLESGARGLEKRTPSPGYQWRYRVARICYGGGLARVELINFFIGQF
jgi:hypothetical protein